VNIFPELREHYHAEMLGPAVRRRSASAVAWFAGLLTLAAVAGSQVGGTPTTSIPALAPLAAKSASAEEPAQVELNPAMSAALESVAQRYRVAPEALAPVFVAVQLAARELDPLLIIAVIGVESGFNPIAQSVMGAQGLMQVIPRFHKDKLGDSGSVAGLLDPVSNVRIGAQVLHEAIRRQGGLVEGLQYYGGAVDDPDRGYATRVLAEKQKLEHAVRARRSSSPVARAGNGSQRSGNQ
jgi:soluble lytic murein transglycosylase-like protein